MSAENSSAEIENVLETARFRLPSRVPSEAEQTTIRYRESAEERKGRRDNRGPELLQTWHEELINFGKDIKNWGTSLVKWAEELELRAEDPDRLLVSVEEITRFFHLREELQQIRRERDIWKLEQTRFFAELDQGSQQLARALARQSFIRIVVSISAVAISAVVLQLALQVYHLPDVTLSFGFITSGTLLLGSLFWNCFFSFCEMASLFCCRGRRPKTPPFSPDTLNELSHDGPVNERNIPTFVIDQYPPSAFDDTTALHTIFGSSSSVRGYRTANLSSQNSSLVTIEHRKGVRERSSGSKLEIVSSKIRKRFSRESRMLKKSSRSKSLRIDGQEDAMAVQPHDVLDDIAASQWGYDSDAEDIHTPHTIQEPMSGTVQVSPKYLNRLIRQIENSHEVPLLEEGIEQNEVLVRDRLKPAKKEFAHEVNQSDDTKLLEGDTSVMGQYKIDNFPEPRTPKNKKAHSIATVWEFGRDESPTQLMRRISVAVSEHSPKYPLDPDAPRGRLPNISRSGQTDWRLSFAAPRRQSSVRRGQDTSPDRTVAVRTHLNRVTSPGSMDQTQGDDCEAAVPPENTIISTTEERLDVTEEVPNTITPTKKAHTQQTSTGGPGKRVEDKSVHLYDMRISQRLASGPFLPLGSPARDSSQRMHSRGHSSLSSLATNPYLVRRRSQASGTATMATNHRPDWLTPATPVTPRRDDSSSVYLSQAGSLVSSAKSSVLHMPHLLEEWTKDAADNRRQSMDRRGFDHTLLSVPNEGEWIRRNTIDTCQSSTDSFRARELANADVRFPSQSRRGSEPKESRFKEVFESPVHQLGLPMRSQSDLIFTHDRKGSGMSRSVSDGWLSGGRRQGFGFEPVPEVHAPSPLPEDDAALLWERALKQHAEEAASIHSGNPSQRKGSMRKESLHRHRRGRKSTRVVSPSVSSELSLSSKAAIRANAISDQNIWTSPGAQDVISRKEKRLGNFSNRSFPSWARFPSHTRKDRTELAGIEDDVIARDFSPPQAVDPQRNSSDLNFRNKRRQKKKTKSMTFGKRNFFSKTYWQRLYRSHSSDMRRFQTGHRSSVSVGGMLEYPELEIIPGGELQFVMREVRGLKRDANATTMAAVTKEESGSRSRSWSWEDERDRVGSAGGQRGTEVRPKPSARMWSRLYEECVDVASRFGKDGVGDRSARVSGEEEYHDALDVRSCETNEVGGGDEAGVDDANGRGDVEVEVEKEVAPVPDRAKTELRSEMSAVVRGLLADEEKAREALLGMVERGTKAE